MGAQNKFILLPYKKNDILLAATYYCEQTFYIRVSVNCSPASLATSISLALSISILLFCLSILHFLLF